MATPAPAMKEARWWVRENGRIHCYLCPRDCRIGDGQAGFCYIRKNVGGTLYSTAHSQPCAIQVDPVEKKPLFHFMPGKRIYSLGTAGCNMGCKFCQNWEISKSKSDQVRAVRLTPEEAVTEAMEYGCPLIAYTYNEPTIWAEYVIDIARVAQRFGIRSVMVTNGYITPQALHDVYRWIDAANVDLKAFTEDFYAKITLTHLKPVLETLQELRRMNVWVEITTLLIPTLNDEPSEIRQICGWILDHLGDEVPLHFTAFHPDFRLRDLPRTSPETVLTARRIAMQAGLKYVYSGNILSPEGANTNCPSCRTLLINRTWHKVQENHLVSGNCPCGQAIPGVFSP
jgi:pyruvate formate lyase activating enzyme